MHSFISTNDPGVPAWLNHDIKGYAQGSFTQSWPRLSFSGFNPHFSPTSYCGGEYIRPGCVMLPRPPRRTVKYDCGGLSRRPCQYGIFTASPRKLVRNAG